MKGYLLDSNTVSRWHSEEQKILARIAQLPTGTPLLTSAIAIGEIQAGHEVSPTTDEERREAFERFLIQKFRHSTLEITWHTRMQYGDLIREILLLHPKPQNREFQRHLSDIGVDLHDVWIAAQALERNLILVTNDQMTVIRSAARNLIGNQLDVEDWTS